MSSAADNPGSSTRPYLVRALHEWCTDNGFTPYVAVHVGPGVLVPMEYVKNNEIVLNVGFDATSGLQLGNEFIEFKARFGGVSREIRVPVHHVIAIYARENGQGMAFPMPADGAAEPSPLPRGLRLAGSEPEASAPAGSTPPAVDTDNAPDGPPEPAGPAGRPALKRIK
jgi:stringent starvation protein B